MKNIIPIAIILTFVVVWAGCTEDDADYVKLSNSSFTFSPDGSEEYIVSIAANGPWTPTFNSTWLTVEQPDAGTLKIGATPTRSNGIRKAQIIITSGHAEEVIELTQLGTNVIFDILEQTSIDYVMSHDGKYIGGIEVKMDNSVYYYTPYIINTQTQERTVMETMTKNHEPAAISNNGIFVIKEFEGTSKFYDTNGTLQDVATLPGFPKVIVSNVSGDGTIFVGYGKKNTDTDKLNYPIKWINNQPQILSAPTEDAFGNPIYLGTMARGCSEDGSIVYGTRWDDYAVVYWKNDSEWEFAGGEEMVKAHQFIIEQNGTLDYQNVIDRPFMLADPNSISSSGKYVAMSYRENKVVNKVPVVYDYPALLDTQTGELNILRTIPDGYASAWGRSVSDNGHMSFVCPLGLSFVGYIYDANTGTVRSTSDYIEQEYGFMLKQDESYIRIFAREGNAILGGTYLYGGSYMDYWYMTVIE